MDITKEVTATVPLEEGEFQISLYSNSADEKEHLALTMGDIHGGEGILVRIHSECFTGDTLGSRRCDCNAQLHQALQMISGEGRGVLIYLRQEGRGIGLRNKLHTYNLQDQGYDTVDANLMLGRKADERNYEMAGSILREFGISSVRLLTNNPNKVQGLQDDGIAVTKRVPLQTTPTDKNRHYLKTKLERLHHELDLAKDQNEREMHEGVLTDLRRRIRNLTEQDGNAKPVVTLSYAQSLDGSISLTPDEPYPISTTESMVLTHGLRALHDAILVGVGTVLADDPQLTVRLEDGMNPRPVIVDTHLRTPLESQLLTARSLKPIIATGKNVAEDKIGRFRDIGTTVLQLPVTDEERVSLPDLLKELPEQDIHSVMVEGGARIITSFFNEHLADLLVLTLAPMIMGGFRGVGELNGTMKASLPKLVNHQYRQINDDLILWGDLHRGEP